MTITVEAVFENGVLRPTQPVALAEGAHVRVTIVAAVDDDPLDAVIGIGESGRADGADRHDRYLYGKPRS